MKNSNSKLKILIKNKDIKKAIKRLAFEISKDYRGKKPLFIGILKGAFIFLADLIRELDFDLEIDFIQLSSYGNKKESSGLVQKIIGLKSEIQNRDIIVIEDIVDTGLTTSFLLEWLEKKEPHSVKLCALTDKPVRREVPIKIDYLGFTIPDKFIVGFGIDFNEQFRNLPHIFYIEGAKI